MGILMWRNCESFRSSKVHALWWIGRQRVVYFEHALNDEDALNVLNDRTITIKVKASINYKIRKVKVNLIAKGNSTRVGCWIDVWSGAQREVVLLGSKCVFCISCSTCGLVWHGITVQGWQVYEFNNSRGISIVLVYCVWFFCMVEFCLKE